MEATLTVFKSVERLSTYSIHKLKNNYNVFCANIIKRKSMK